MNLSFMINQIKYNIKQTDKGYVLTHGKIVKTRKTMEEILMTIKDTVLYGMPKGTMHEFCEDISTAMAALKSCTRYIKKEMAKHDTL